ncbi:hypothetical protein RhiirA4_542163 [Rhizophagus irregularis]|uniref:Ubiquitin-like protease family profile domain-containing protein n=2 Tax=Rhizophagus irregularis TaxID=588596 RepID=A0A2I1GDZ6_9GLOM|nr:hypothetical protein RhiirA4_542163 [Rhizophagus irregularis]
MECWGSKSPEKRVMHGRITMRRQERKAQERFVRLKKISKQRYTNVPKDLLELYENKFGVAEKFKSPAISKSLLESYENKFGVAEKFKSPARLGVADTTIERSRPLIPLTFQKRAEKSINGLKDPTYNYSTPIASPTPSYVSVRSSPTPSYVSTHNYSLSPRLSSASSIEFPKELPPPPQLVKTCIQQSCYTYYNTKTFEQINSLELLDPQIYNKLNSWICNKSIVNVERVVKKSEDNQRVLVPQETLCWSYNNRRTGDQRRSFQRLKKTDEEDEWCYKTTVLQYKENPEVFSIEAESRELQESISKESEQIMEENREYATKEEIQEELRCLETVEEMGVQAAIKHIKEENKNNDNLKAYICRELSLKSPRNESSLYNGNLTNKKRSATRRLRDWIQCDGYPSLTLEQAEKLVVMLNSGDKILVEGDKVSVRGNDLITLKKRGWLNDEVINFYVELILKRAAREPEKYPKIHMFNTFFYPLLEKKGYSGVARITKRAKLDIFSLDMVIVPIHLQIHWALAVINIKERRLEYYDSMSKGCNESVLSLLKHYVEEEYKDKKKAPSYDTSEWKYYRVNNLPQQTNAYDCGVFSMTFAEHISRGASVLFTPPRYMKYFRLKMMWEIIDSELLPVDQQLQPCKVSEPVKNGSITNNYVNYSGQKRTFEDNCILGN